MYSEIDFIEEVKCQSSMTYQDEKVGFLITKQDGARIHCAIDNIVVKQWIDAGNEILPFTSDISFLKSTKICQVKLEAAKRIESAYPQYKQLNNAAAVMEILNKENYATKRGTIYYLTDEDLKTLKKAKGCKDYINLIRLKSDLLETLINSKISTEDLTSIDISDDKYWI